MRLGLAKGGARAEVLRLTRSGFERLDLAQATRASPAP